MAMDARDRRRAGIFIFRVVGIVAAGLNVAAGCGNLNDVDDPLAVTSRGSQSASGVQGDAASSTNDPTSLSSDGTWVAFISSATNLVPGDTNAQTDVFVKNTKTGAIERANLDSSGNEGSGTSTSNGTSSAQGGCSDPQVSSNGRYAVFESNQTNLVTGDTNTLQDIFVRDLTGGTTQRVTVSGSGAQVTQDSPFVVTVAGSTPSISSDGRFVAFESKLDVVIGHSTSGKSHIYLWDRNLGTTKRIGLKSDGTASTTGSSGSTSPIISADGSLVSFTTDYTDLLSTPSDTNGQKDVYLCSVATGKTIDRGSLTSSGVQGATDSFTGSISQDGRYVVFVSQSAFDAGGANLGYLLIWKRDRTTGTTTLVSADSSGVKATAACFTPSISAAGRYIAFSTDAANLVSGDTNAATDIFVRDTVAGTTVRVSVNTFNEQSQGAQFVSGSDIKQKGSSFPSISADGLFVAFVSEATNLVVSDSNGVADIFVRGPLR